MKDIMEQAGIVTQRHQDDYKPVGFEFLYQDGRTPRKFHHIIVTADGETWYNQTIQYDAIVRSGKEIQAACWQDFYEWELVADWYKHGYQKYIDQAVSEVRILNRAKRIEERKCVALEVDESFRMFVNQGYRDAKVVGVIGDQALVIYRMPRGRYSIRVLEHNVALGDRKQNTIYLTGREHSCVEGFRYRDLRGYPRSKIIQKWCAREILELIDDIILHDELDYS